MDSIDLIFRLMAVSQVLTWAVFCLFFHRTRTGYLVLFLSLGIAGYLVSPFPFEFGGYNYFRLIGGFAGSLVPALAWLLAFRLFTDEARIPAFFYGVAATYLVLMEFPFSFNQSFDESLSQIIFFLFPQCLKLGLIAHAGYLTLHGRAVDLIESRLQLRVPIALTFAAVTTIVILVEINFASDVPKIILSGGAGILLLFTFLVTVMSLRVHPGLLAIVGAPPEIRAVVSEIDDDPHKEVIERIHRLMEEERYYANYDVTLNALSGHLNVPAYKLRGVINQGMGFRNFNQFLNSFRIQEAGERLLSDGKLPILTIALDTGFRSLSAFNKAFRDIHKMTPTEFRVQLQKKGE